MKSKRFLFDKPQAQPSELFYKLVFYCIFEYETVYLHYFADLKARGEEEPEMTFAEFAVENLMNIQEAMSPLLFAMVFGVNNKENEKEPITEPMMAEYIRDAMKVIEEEDLKYRDEKV
jgi:hypothetical protein